MLDTTPSNSFPSQIEQAFCSLSQQYPQLTFRVHDQHGRSQSWGPNPGVHTIASWSVSDNTTLTIQVLAETQLDLPTLCGELNRLGPLCTAILEQAQQITHLEQYAWHDSLTGLLNRQGWDRQTKIEIQRAARMGYPLGLLLLDLDQLKTINDRQGYQAGDALLQKTAATLLQHLRCEDLCARWGGDEFAILAVNCSEANLALIAERLQRSLAAAGIAASWGWSALTTDLASAWQIAEQMLKESRGNK
jgi:diguanylate cyclase (GGDEF)-like protein